MKRTVEAIFRQCKILLSWMLMKNKATSQQKLTAQPVHSYRSLIPH